MLQVAKTFHDDTLLGCSTRETLRVLSKFKHHTSNCDSKQDAKQFFITHNEPFCVANIDNLKELIVNLNDKYSINEEQGICQYDLIVSSKTENDFLQLTCYGTRIFLDLKIDNLQFTQFQVKNTIFQKYTLKLPTFHLKVYKQFNSNSDLTNGSLHFDNTEERKDMLWRSRFYNRSGEGYDNDEIPPVTLLDSDVYLYIATFVGKVNYQRQKRGIFDSFKVPFHFSYRDNVGNLEIRDKICLNIKGVNYILRVGPLSDIIVTPIDYINSNFSIGIKNSFSQQFDIDFICDCSLNVFKSVYEIGLNLSKNDLTNLINDKNIRFDITFGIEGVVHSMQIVHLYENTKYYRKQIYHKGIVIFDAVAVERKKELSEHSILEEIDDINCCSANIHGNILANNFHTIDLHDLVCPVPTFSTLTDSLLIQLAKNRFSMYSQSCNYHESFLTAKLVNNTVIIDTYRTYESGKVVYHKKEYFKYDSEKLHINDLEIEKSECISGKYVQCVYDSNFDISSETYDSDDHIIEIIYDPPIYTYGGGCGCFGKRKTKTTVKDKQDQVQSISKREHNNDGHLTQKMSLDENNALTIVSTEDDCKKKSPVKYAYKAAITSDGIRCVVKLVIPDDAQVIWSEGYDKYRVSKAYVYSIKPVIDGNYAQDIMIEQCVICADKIGNVMALPCKHKLCEGCWEKVDKCPFCRSSVTHHKVLKPCRDNTEMSFVDALSFVHTSNFSYIVGQMIEIPHFDSDKSKPCSNGIHCHFKESDVFKWFEYLDIPEHARQIILNMNKAKTKDENENRQKNTQNTSNTNNTPIKII